MHSGWDTLRWKCWDYELVDPTKWDLYESVRGDTGEVRDRGGRLLERDGDFSFWLGRRGGSYFGGQFSARAGSEAGDNLSLLRGGRLAWVKGVVSERVRGVGVEADVLGAVVARADWAVDLYGVDALLVVEALGKRLDLRGFVQDLDRPNSKRWVSGGNRPSRVVRLYDKGVELGRPELGIVRLEVSWNEVKNVRRHLGRGKDVVLDDLLTRPEIGSEAFRRLIEPALPEAVEVGEGRVSDAVALYERAGRDRALMREAMAQAFERLHMGEGARLNAIRPHSRGAHQNEVSQQAKAAPLAEWLLTELNEDKRREAEAYRVARSLLLSSPEPAGSTPVFDHHPYCSHAARPPARTAA